MNWNSIIKRHDKITPPTEGELRSFEKNIGYDLPHEYRRFLLEINGGQVTQKHGFNIEGNIMGVEFLDAFSGCYPFGGIKESRIRDGIELKMMIRQLLRIGSDGGTGWYYIMLDGKWRGSIFFCYCEDVFDEEERWENPNMIVPPNLHFISNSFDGLGELISTNATGEEKWW